jgi:hypothetical protein
MARLTEQQIAEAVRLIRRDVDAAGALHEDVVKAATAGRLDAAFDQLHDEYAAPLGKIAGLSSGENFGRLLLGAIAKIAQRLEHVEQEAQSGTYKIADGPIQNGHSPR